EVLWITRVDDDGMHLRSVGGSILHAAHPDAVLGFVIHRREWLPGHAAVFRAEQPLRRSSRVPDVRLVAMCWREPEGVVHAAALGAFGRLRKGGRFRCFLPGLAEIGRAKNGRPQMAGLRGRE